MNQPTNIENLNGDAQFNEAGGSITQAGGDVVGGNKTEIHHHYGENKANPPLRHTPDTSFLPYLLNRQKQEDDLIEAIAQHKNFQQPLLCIVRGSDDDCCSERFVERIARNVLPQVTATKNQLKDGYQKSFIKTEDFKNADQLHRNMRRSLGESFAHNKTADLAEIKAAMRAIKTPILLYAALSTEDCRQCDGVNTLHYFLRFWQDFEMDQGDDYLILVCLFFYHQPSTPNFMSSLFGKKDLDLQIQTAFEQKTGFEHCTLLDRLEPIKEVHLRNWSESDDVRKFFNRSIYDDVCEEVEAIRRQQESKELALGFLAKKLKPVLEQLALQVKP
ncbi:MAG: hypothetical protein PHI11_04155 [Gallionella sp.]|nr:hypothetical protein [Gallionella sp.]